MTPEAAIYNFLSGFGIPAYASTSVPDRDGEDAPPDLFPYITYDLIENGWEDGEVVIPVNVWYRTESEREPNAKVREIAYAIGMSGVTLRCDGGMLWLKRGTPWSQSVNVSGEDDMIKRRYLNIDVEYLTIG